MKFGNLHATRVKDGWEFRIYVEEKYFSTRIPEEESTRLVSFIGEVNQYMKGWDTIDSGEEKMTVNVRTHQDEQDVWLDMVEKRK